MNCPLCGKELIMKEKQVGTSENGSPIFNKYAICYDCKKQWNLDKNKMKKKTADGSSAQKTKAIQKPDKEQPAGQERPAKKAQPAGQERPAKKAQTAGQEQPVKPARSDRRHPSSHAPHAGENTATPQRPRRQRQESESADQAQAKPRRRTANPSGSVQTGKKPTPGKKEGDAALSRARKERAAGQAPRKKRYGNIPPEHIRQTSEGNVKKAYEDMLSTSALSKKELRKAAAEKPSHKAKRDRDRSDEERMQAVNTARTAKAEAAIRDDMYEDDDEEPVIYLRIPRVIVGLLSILGFGFFAYEAFMAGIQSASEGGLSGHGMTYIIMSICCLLSAIVLLGLQKKNTIFAFLLPIAFFGAAGGYGFLNRDSIAMLTYGAIALAVLALLMLVLLIVYLTSGEEYDEDYDDDDFNEY